MDQLTKSLISGVVQAAMEHGPNVSPLEGVDPKGRFDVLASRMIERVVNTSGKPGLTAAYGGLKPTVDTVLAKLFNQPKPKKPRKRRAKHVR